MVTLFGISLRGLQLPKVCGRGVVQTATRPNVIRKVLEWPRRMSGKPLIESALGWVLWLSLFLWWNVSGVSAAQYCSW